MPTSTVLFAELSAAAGGDSAAPDDGVAAAVATHLTLVRRIIDRFGGRVTKSLRHSITAVFESAYDAVRSAIAIQQETAREARDAPDSVAVRVGMNIGEVIDGDDDVFGAAVVVARQLCGAASPGQIVVAEMIEHLLRRRADITFAATADVEIDGSLERAFEIAWQLPSERLAPHARVVVADDAGLLRAGIVNLLGARGFDVVAEAADFDGVVEAVTRHRPDLLVTDIRMPPTNTDEGIRAAVALRATYPGLAVLVLSQYVEAGAAVELLNGSGAGVGYLLKERVSEVDEFVDAALTVLSGRHVIDPAVAEGMMQRRDVREAVTRLSERERDVLAQMATGASNSAIAAALFVSTKTVETHVSSILTKLDLPDIPEGNRRVQAVLRFLEATR
jgi:DNA-binding NarL/FixJ family response regulator